MTERAVDGGAANGHRTLTPASHRTLSALRSDTTNGREPPNLPSQRLRAVTPPRTASARVVAAQRDWLQEAQEDALAHHGIEGRIEAELNLVQQAKPTTALEFQSPAPPPQPMLGQQAEPQHPAMATSTAGVTPALGRARGSASAPGARSQTTVQAATRGPTNADAGLPPPSGDKRPVSGLGFESKDTSDQSNPLPKFNSVPRTSTPPCMSVWAAHKKRTATADAPNGVGGTNDDRELSFAMDDSSWGGNVNAMHVRRGEKPTEAVQIA